MADVRSIRHSFRPRSMLAPRRSRPLACSSQLLQGGDASYPQMRSTSGSRMRGANNRQPMAFAGLWEGFKWPDGTVLRTFTIITTNANETGDELHNRMPAIVAPQDWPTWLGEVEGDPATLLRPAGEDVLKFWPVSKQVNSPRNNGAELLEVVR